MFYLCGSSRSDALLLFFRLIFEEYCDIIHIDAAQDAFCAASGKTHMPDLTVQTLVLTERRVA